MRTKWLVAIIAGLAAVLLGGCNGGGSGNDDISRIKGRYREMQKGLEAKDIQRAMSVWSYDYLDNGVTFDDIKNGIANLFLDFNNIHEELDFHDIRVFGNTATVSWTETLTATDAYTGQVNQAVTDYNDIWRYEYGDWFLYGNQSASAPGVRKEARYSGQRLRAAPVKMK